MIARIESDELREYDGTHSCDSCQFDAVSLGFGVTLAQKIRTIMGSLHRSATPDH